MTLLILLTGLTFAAVVVLGVFLFFHVRKSEKRQQGQIQQMERRLQDMRIIQELSGEINTHLELERLLPVLMEVFVKAAGVNKGSILLLNEETGLLEIRAHVGLSERAVRETRFKLGEGVAGVVAQTGRPILVNDTTRDQLYKDIVLDPLKDRPKESMLVLPLPYRGAVLGCICLQSKYTGEQFIRRDELLLEPLANLAGIAVQNAKLYQMAITDGLTKLYIHRYFQHRLDEELQRSRRYKHPLSVAILDLDHFKELNDRYGHPTGDRILAGVARVLRETVRASDICCRYGGEEFAVIMPEAALEEARLGAERIRRALEKTPIQTFNGELRVTSSAGVASTPHNGVPVVKEELIRRADEMLYEAKRQGRNRVCAFE